MKAIFRLFGLLSISCLSLGAQAPAASQAPAAAQAPAVANPADLSGAWSGSFDFNGNSVPVTLNLKIANNVVTGTIEGLPTTPIDIQGGKLEADAITFTAKTDYQGESYNLVFKGKVTGNQIAFDFGTDDGSWGTTLTVTRAAAASSPAAAAAPAPQDVTGAWKGAFDFNGTSIPVTFNLKSAGGAVTGNVEGMGPAPVEIHGGKIDGDGVTFSIDVDYQGETHTLNYKGKVVPGEIDFEFGTTDGAWGSTINAKKA